MSNPEEHERKQNLPYLDPSLIINTRLNEIERQQSEDKAEQKKHASSQRTTNWLLTIFTALLFVTSCVSDFILLRQASISRESANAATSAAETAAETLNRSIEQFRADERAWIELEPIKPVSIVALPQGKVFSYSIYPKNVGRTAARDIVVKAQNLSGDASLGENATWVSEVQNKIRLDRFKDKTGKTPEDSGQPSLKFCPPALFPRLHSISSDRNGKAMASPCLT